MSTLPFAHLHCHSHYSLLGRGRPDPRPARAGQGPADERPGADRPRQSARGAGVLPDGQGTGHQSDPRLEAYIAPGSRFHKEAGGTKEASYHLTLLAQNRTGFQNLVKLSSAAFLEGFYFKPRIDKELLAAHQRGADLPERLRLERVEPHAAAGTAARPTWRRPCEIAAWFQRAVRRPLLHRDPEQRPGDRSGMALEAAVEVARRLGIPLVATSDAHYVHREDAEAQDVLLCINTGKFRTDTNRMRMEGNEFYLRSPEEMYAAFPGHGRRRAPARQEIADTRRHRAGAGQAALSRLHAAGGQDRRRTTCASCAWQGLQGALRRPARALRRRRAFRRGAWPGSTASWT